MVAVQIEGCFECLQVLQVQLGVNARVVRRSPAQARQDALVPTGGATLTCTCCRAAHTESRWLPAAAGKSAQHACQGCVACGTRHPTSAAAPWHLVDLSKARHGASLRIPALAAPLTLVAPVHQPLRVAHPLQSCSIAPLLSLNQQRTWLSFISMTLVTSLGGRSCSSRSKCAMLNRRPIHNLRSGSRLSLCATDESVGKLAVTRFGCGCGCTWADWLG